LTDMSDWHKCVTPSSNSSVLRRLQFFYVE